VPAKHKILFVVLGTVSAIATGFCVLLGCSYPRSLSPYDLATCCAVLNYRGEQAGTGFFIQTKSSQNNTYLVTALHTIKLIREIAGQDCFDIQAIVKRRDAKGGTELTIPWDYAAFRPNADPFDLAFIRITNNLLAQADAYVTPLILEYETPSTGDTNADVVADDSRWVYSASENIRHEIAAANSTPAEARVSLARAGHPGLLLYASRKKYSVQVGCDLFTLASQKYFANEGQTKPFPVFLRTGVLAFCGIDGSDSELPLSGESYEPFLIACQSSKGNSGAPVFVNVKTSRFNGSVCVTPHLLGVLTGAVNASGPTQTLDVAVYSAAGKPLGRMKDAPVFIENAGFSVVSPADYLAHLLIDYETRK